MSFYSLLPIPWREFLEIDDNYFKKLDQIIPSTGINPPRNLIFNAFQVNPSEVKAVIIGQDPYPNVEDACGLAFSTQSKKIPASLRNIKKELFTDLQIPISNSGDLTPWVNQGVLLLNRILTTKSGVSLAHEKIGWEVFTDLVISKLANTKAVFILWGKRAEKAGESIPIDKKIVGVHPSPLSANRGFFGSKPFSECNAILKSNGMSPINWQF